MVGVVGVVARLARLAPRSTDVNLVACSNKFAALGETSGNTPAPARISRPRQ